MRIVELSPILTIILDVAVWFFIHIGCTILSLKLPDSVFENDRWIYTTRKWERGGAIWQQIFRVRRWKNYLPDGAAVFSRGVFSKGFRKKYMQSRDKAYFQTFVRESRRAELTHWMIMLPAPFFFLWNPFEIGWIMIFYAILANGPCIIAQRYNRPRFTRIMADRV